LVVIPDAIASLPFDRFDQIGSQLAEIELEEEPVDQTEQISVARARLDDLEQQERNGAPWGNLVRADREQELDQIWNEWSENCSKVALAQNPSQNSQELLAWRASEPWRTKMDHLIEEIQSGTPSSCTLDAITRWQEERQLEQDRMNLIPDDGGRLLLDRTLDSCRAFQNLAVDQTDYYLSALHQGTLETNRAKIAALREHLELLQLEQERWLEYHELARIHQSMSAHVEDHRRNMELRKELARIDALMSQHSLTTSQLKSLERSVIRKRDQLREQTQSILEKADNRDLEQLQIAQCHTLAVSAIWRDTCYHHYQGWKKDHRKMLSNRVAMETDRIHLQMAIQQLVDLIESLSQTRKNIAKCQAKAEKYLAYQKLTHSSGLPYYMMKHYLPLIEAEINRSLHHMVSFDVLFSFVGDGRETDARSIANRTAKSNSVDVQIRHPNGVVLDVRSGSGLEKFAVSFAIRITLQRISRMPRSNFFVMDEVWGSIDADNMTRLDQMLRPLCAQIDYLLVISQSDDLRQLVDHAIMVNKEDEISRVHFA
jgi:DNA repair exonuclease SbcCD ATPase subunit